jgi:predicted amidohydrolase YtcJ
MEPSLPQARALAIAGEWIVGGVGTHEAALASPDRVDLRGRCVLPGFNDSHVHFPTWALAQQEVRLEGTRSLEEAVSLVRDAVGGVRPGGWLRGRGWRSADWSPAVEPAREVLDAVTGSVPTMLTARDSHSCWLNSAALSLADGDLAVPGGVVEVDSRGEPTGVLREESCWHFRDRYAAALEVFQRLESEGSLSLRVWQSLPYERVEELAALGLRSGFGSSLLRVGYLKAFMDGTLGSQTARLLDGSGVQITSREELEEIVRAGVRAGFPVAVHAIGDLANREALDAFEATRSEWAPLGLRQRIEHAQLLPPEDVARFASVGVAASVQFSHAPSDRDVAERFWAGKLDGAYAFRALWESGAVVANGSDAPIEELDPWAGVVAGVLRTLDDRPAWRPEQSVTVEQALQATTVTPAWLAYDERRRGKLVPGHYADVVVLDRDPLACKPEELPEVQVVATMLGGRWVHNPPPWD